MGWWCLCLAVGLFLIWRNVFADASVVARAVITALVVAAYTVSIFLFRFLIKPVPPPSS
ncbi:hypothetical protein [Streptomyces sp. NPDC001070]